MLLVRQDATGFRSVFSTAGRNVTLITAYHGSPARIGTGRPLAKQIDLVGRDLTACR